MSNKLEEARKIINEVDAQMAELFVKRMRAAEMVSEHKKMYGLPILDVARENAVIEKNTALIEDEILKVRQKDLKLCQTTVGPHRDDMLFSVNDIDIRKFGSQGQQRTAALSLKLSEIELVKKVTKDTPVLLLDDVLSELDSNRQNYLLNSIGDIQTIITCTGLDDFINNRFEINKIFKVTNGTVANEN